MITVETLKYSARNFQAELCEAAETSDEAKKLLRQMEPFIVEACTIVSISEFTFCRLRFDRPFFDGPLADNNKLANAYAKFSNQFEGLEV